MENLKIFMSVLIISQFISGCIALIPPSHVETSREIIVVIYEPYPEPTPEPMPEPPCIVRPPATKPAPPVERPKNEKYRNPADIKSVDRERPVDSSKKNEGTRNSGERRGR